MSKTEMLRQSAAASNEKRLAHLAQQIETVRQAKYQSTEDLAAILEPLAQAMAALTDETRQTLALIDQRARDHAESFMSQLQQEVSAFQEISAQEHKAAEQMKRAGQHLRWRVAAVAVMASVLTAALVIGSWHWVRPQRAAQAVTLDSRAVARLLAPAVIAALRPSSGR
jgi:anti-sigma factor ChrR (cupin superfamily)